MPIREDADKNILVPGLAKKEIHNFDEFKLAFGPASNNRYCIISFGNLKKSLNSNLSFSKFAIRLYFWEILFLSYSKDPKFSDAKKLSCNLPKIQTKRSNLRVFCQNDANGIANGEDPDQTAPLGTV